MIHARAGRARALALALALVTGCGGAGGNPGWRNQDGSGGAPGSGGGVPGKPRELTPGGTGATRYNDPADAASPPSSPIADAILGAVQAGAVEAGDPVPAADARLYAVAQDLADFLDGGELPPYAAIEFALAFHGLVEPSPELILIEGDERDPAGLGEAVRDKLPQSLQRGDFTRVGVGVVHVEGTTVRAVLALQASALETEPFPRQVALGGSVMLRGRVLPPYGEPTLYVTTPAGNVDKQPVVRDGGAGFRAEIACPGEGRRQVEIIGRGPSGVTVLANFPVFCGVAPPRSVTIVAPVGDRYRDAGEAEKVIFAQLNRDRAAHGLGALAWSDRAATIARAHSVDMQQHDFVAHVSPRSGSAGDRAKAGGLATPLVLENVARAYSPSEVQTGFMNSPGHRGNVLSTDATHVGIGVVLGREVNGKRELYVTQVFFRVPPRISAVQAREQATTALVAARRQAGAAELRLDKDLETIAQQLAEGLARGQDRDQAAHRAEVQQEALASRFSSVVTIVVVVGDPSTFADESVHDARSRSYGLGLAQGDHPDLGKDSFYVVVLLGRPR